MEFSKNSSKCNSVIQWRIMIQVNKFMIVHQIMLQDKQNHDYPTTPSPIHNKKTVSLKIISLANQKEGRGSIFRKPKKVIKALKIDPQPKFEDKFLINQQLKNWLSKLQESKDSQNTKQKTQSQEVFTQRNKEAINTVYDLMRKDEKLAQCLPLTNRQQQKSQKNTLQLNLEEVSHLRSKSSKRKVAIQQIYFQSQMQSKSSHYLGFRPAVSKCPQRLVWNKKNVILNSPKVSSLSFLSKSKIRTYSLQNQRERNRTLQTIKQQKSESKIFDSPSRIGNYTSRSRQRKCWQSIGLKEWINKPTLRDSHFLKS